MDEFTTLAFLLAIALLGALVLGVMAFFKVSMLEQRIGVLEAALRRLAAGREKPVEAGRAETAPPSTAVDSVRPAPAPATAAPEQAGVAASEALSAGVSEQAPEQVSEPAAELPVYSPTAPSYQAPSATPAFSSGPDLFDRLLQNIRNNWMVWLGGICMSLTEEFMVRYSIEQGLLGPETRVVL